MSADRLSLYAELTTVVKFSPLPTAARLLIIALVVHIESLEKRITELERSTPVQG